MNPIVELAKRAYESTRPIYAIILTVIFIVGLLVSKALDMYSNEFTVTLLSDEKGLNTHSQFTVQLPQPILFDENWTVGLSELSFMVSWPLVTLDRQTEATMIVHYGDHLYPISLSKMRHNSVKSIISDIHSSIKSKNEAEDDENMNSLLMESKSASDFVIDFVHTNGGELELGKAPLKLYLANKKVQAKAEDQLLHRVWLPDKIKKALGFHSNTLNFTEKDRLRGENHYDEEYDQPIFVYADIIKPQIVGSHMAKLLRAVNIEYAPGSRQSYQPISVNYMPVEKTECGSITITIRSIDGSRMNILEGPTIVQLKFRV